MLHTRRTFSYEYPPEQADFALLGVPWDCAEVGKSVKSGPLFIREALKLLPGYDPKTRQDPFETKKWTDLGDLEAPVNNWPLTRDAIKETVKELLTANPKAIPVTLGGDHLITLAVLEQLKESFGKPFTVVHFDAHADLMPEWLGEKYAHITWGYHTISQLKLPLVQYGVRSLMPPEVEVTKKYKVPQNLARVRGPVYVTVDLDVFDPGFAPDVGTPEPEGMDPKTFFALLERVLSRNKLIGLDVMECASDRLGTSTAVLAAQIIKKAAIHSR